MAGIADDPIEIVSSSVELIAAHAAPPPDDSTSVEFIGESIELHAVPPPDGAAGDGYDPGVPWPTVTGVKGDLAGTHTINNIIPINLDPPYTPFGDPLGEGGYGSVQGVKDAASREYAMKTMLMRTDGEPHDNPRRMMKAMREVIIQKDLDDPYICKMADVYRMQNNTVKMLMELCVMDLNVYIHNTLKGKDGIHKLGLIKHIVIGILNGLVYMHEKGYAHRDLKGENIFLKAHGGIKIGDFGGARLVEERSERVRHYSLHVCTWTTCAPEMLLENTDYGVEVDMWSVACIISHMFMGYVFPRADAAFAFLEGKHRAQLLAIASLCGNFPESLCPRIAENFPLYMGNTRQIGTIFYNKVEGSELAMDLIETAFQLDPTIRKQAWELLNHDFLQRLDIAAIRTLD